MHSNRWQVRIGGAFVVAVVALGGCGLGGTTTTPTAADPTVAGPTAQPEQGPEEESLAAEPTATATSPAAKPRPRRSPQQQESPRPVKKPRPKPAKKPAGDKPPPVKRPKPKPGCTEKFVGKALPRAKVKQALTTAAGTTYWPVSAPDLTVPLKLVKAVAWQESTWRSHVRACDGGVGLMQVMPDTAVYLNQRFEKSYDIATPADNARLGVNYLAWLTKYFGDVYFEGDYDLAAADCAGTTDMCLLNMVISGYNYGFGAVDDAYDNNKPLPNPGYVKSVRKLLTSCECLSY